MEITKPGLKRLALKKVPLFGTMSEPERDALVAMVALREFEQGESIILATDVGREVMFVVDGAVDVKRSSEDGREVIISRLGIGQLFGEIAVLTAATRSADVVAAENCMVLSLKANDFEELLSRHQSFVRALLVDLANRVLAASTRISDLALLDVYCRVFRALQSLARAAKAQNSMTIERPTHKDLAAMVGTSREMVTRALTKLEADQLISCSGKNVTLLAAELPDEEEQ